MNVSFPPGSIVFNQGDAGNCLYIVQSGVVEMTIGDKVVEVCGPNEAIGFMSMIDSAPRRRPLAAFGNSDGDLQMLQYTTLSGGPGFGLLVHHTDAEREYAYDRQSHFGKLDKALDAAAINKWTVVDMKNDWKRIFPVA